VLVTKTVFLVWKCRSSSTKIMVTYRLKYASDYNTTFLALMIAKTLIILPRVAFMIDGFWTDDRTYWTLNIACDYTSQITITDYCCSQSCCLVAAFNGGRSSASGLTSILVEDHLTPTSYYNRWFQLLAPGWTDFQLQLSILDSLSSRTNWLPTAKLTH
jgi:hypothetical protein